MTPDLKEWIEIVLVAAPPGFQQQLEPLLYALEQALLEKVRDCDRLRQTISGLEADLSKIQQDNTLLKHRLFGASSERMDTTDQPEVRETISEAPSTFDADLSVSHSSDPKKLQHKKPRGLRGKQRSPLPEHLTVEDVIMDISSKVCPCGDTLRLIGKPEVLKRLCTRKAACYIRQEIYLKYKCSCCNQFLQAKTPRRLLENSRYDSSFWADIITSKFADGLPLYRQNKRLARGGLNVPISTLSRGLTRISLNLDHLRGALRDYTLSGETLDVDETRLPMLAPGKGKTHNGFMWAYCRDDRRWKPGSAATVLFDFQLSRAGNHADSFLRDFSGSVMVDGYSGYACLEAPGRAGGPIQRAFCNTHARRYFVEADTAAPSKIAKVIIAKYAEIFCMERSTYGLLPQVREDIRKRELKPLFNGLSNFVDENWPKLEVGSKLYKAMAYYRSHISGLTMFLEDGRLEIDNNIVENAIRPLAILRKNSLFAGAELGGKAWAFFASLVGTCNLNGVDPSAYLSWLFHKVESGYPFSQYDKLLPWHCPAGQFSINKL